MKKCFYIIVAFALTVACSVKQPMQENLNEMVFEISYPATKATESGFTTGDCLSLWAVEQPGGDHVPLQISGNFFNNEALVYDGAKWAGSRKLYWSDSPCDFYAVYPFLSEISSVEQQPFSIQMDQNAAATDSSLSGYEASDLLFASAANVSRGDGTVKLQFKHLLSKLTIKLVKGEKFEGEIPEDIIVHIYNTVTSGKLNLEKGSIVKDDFGGRETITCRKQSETEFDVILIPQNIESRTPLVEVTMGGIAYLLEYSLSLRPGYHHTISLTVNTSPDQEQIEIGIDADIDDWN